jgi:hypothetical protein
VDGARSEDARQASDPKYHGHDCVIVGKRGHDHVAGRKISETRGTMGTDSLQSLHTLWVSVTDEDLMAVSD